MAATDLRPLSLGELLDRTFAVYRHNFFLFVGIAGIPQLFLLPFQMFTAIYPAANKRAGGQPDVETLLVLFVLLFGLVTLIAQIAGYALAQGATVYAVSELTLGRQTTIRQAYRHMRGEIGTIVAVTFLVGLATGIGFILLIVPGIYVLLATALAVPAAVLENLHAREAISRSMEMTKGHRSRVFVIFLVVTVMTIVAFFVFQFPFQFVQAQTGPSVVLGVLIALGGFIGTAVVAPLGTVAFSLLYYDIRVRNEAFDLQMMMAQLDGTPLPFRAPRTSGPPSILTG